MESSFEMRVVIFIEGGLVYEIFVIGGVYMRDVVRICLYLFFLF